MKRLRVILLFLLLGAIVNVAVAWGIALTVSLKNWSDSLSEGLFYSNNGSWHIVRHEGFGSYVYMSIHTKDHFDDEDVLKYRELYSDKPIENVKPYWGSMNITTDLFQTLSGSSMLGFELRKFESRGWPFSIFWCLREIGVSDGSVITRYGSRGFIKIPFLPEYNWGPRGLPLYPIWTGFVVNMLFYAVLLWLLLTGQRSLRRFIRLKRGLCMKCAYDLRGADHKACPECGTAREPRSKFSEIVP